jgi:hypothetical protein
LGSTDLKIERALYLTHTVQFKVCIVQSMTCYAVGLKFVQFCKNTGYHSGIKQTPYEALFGTKPMIGLRSSALPAEVLERMISEDDLLAAFSSCSTKPVQESSNVQILSVVRATVSIEDTSIAEDSPVGHQNAAGHDAAAVESLSVVHAAASIQNTSPIQGSAEVHQTASIQDVSVMQSVSVVEGGESILNFAQKEHP